MDFLFSNKKKNILAICFSALHIIMLILNANFQLSLFQNLRYAINSLVTYLTPIIPPILLLVCLFACKKECSFKKWLLPIAFGIPVTSSFISLLSIFSIIGTLVSIPQNRPILFCSFLMFLSIILVFIGTLTSDKNINFLKYGALSYALLNFVVLIIDFINAGGFAYLKNIPAGVYPINIIAFIRTISCALFYLEIFILTTNKKNYVLSEKA